MAAPVDRSALSNVPQRPCHTGRVEPGRELRDLELAVFSRRRAGRGHRPPAVRVPGWSRRRELPRRFPVRRSTMANGSHVAGGAARKERVGSAPQVRPPAQTMLGGLRYCRSCDGLHGALSSRYGDRPGGGGDRRAFECRGGLVRSLPLPGVPGRCKRDVRCGYQPRERMLSVSTPRRRRRGDDPDRRWCRRRRSRRA